MLSGGALAALYGALLSKRVLFGPEAKVRDVAAMLKAEHAQKEREGAQRKLEAVAEKLESIRLKKAAELIRDGMPETLAYCRFSREQWARI